MPRIRSLAPLAVLRRWATQAQQDACRNARVAATESARRRLQRAEVELYLESLRAPVRVAGHG